MMADSFTIRIFVPNGDPEGIRLIDRLNWTGIGVAFPRSKWKEVRDRSEVDRMGIYILSGYSSDDVDLPTIYIGQTDDLKHRIDKHNLEKPFWDSGIFFVSTSGSLNRGHITWLEYALIKQAQTAARCKLDNETIPREPALSEADIADTMAFLKEILQILPLVGLRSFEKPKHISNFISKNDVSARVQIDKWAGLDTVIVPAQKEGFENVFLGKNCWYAIRIAGGMLNNIRYIAAYQTQPISAITHLAKVDYIEPYGEDGKYKLVFSGEAEKIGPIVFGDAQSGAMQGPRYTSYSKLKSAKKLSDLLVKAVS